MRTPGAMSRGFFLARVTIVICAACLFIGCTTKPKPYKLPGPYSYEPSSENVARDRFVAQCRDEANRIAVVNPNKKERDGGYASSYRLCVTRHSY